MLRKDVYPVANSGDLQGMRMGRGLYLIASYNFKERW